MKNGILKFFLVLAVIFFNVQGAWSASLKLNNGPVNTIYTSSAQRIAASKIKVTLNSIKNTVFEVADEESPNTQRNRIYKHDDDETEDTSFSSKKQKFFSANIPTNPFLVFACESVYINNTSVTAQPFTYFCADKYLLHQVFRI